MRGAFIYRKCGYVVYAAAKVGESFDLKENFGFTAILESGSA